MNMIDFDTNLADAVIADHWQAETLSADAAGHNLRWLLPLGN